jgi:hypothetical protein
MGKAARTQTAVAQHASGDIAPRSGRYIRIQLSLRPEYAQRLEWLRKSLGVTSYAEVVREALRQTEQLAKLAGPDGKISVENPDGTRTYIMR